MKQSPNDAVCSLWLGAAAEDEGMLAEIIAELAQRHATPNFHPHLTLLGDIPEAPEALTGRLMDVARAADPFALPVRAVMSGDAYFRSFYALFDAGPELLALRRAAETRMALASGAFMPHVSLLYGPVPEPEKAQSVSEVGRRLAGRLIRFDRLVVTNSADAVPVAEWRILKMAALGRGPARP